MRLGHTACRKGKRVSIKLKNGQIIVGKFIDRTDSFVMVEGFTPIHKENIRSFMIIRGVPHAETR